MNKREDVIDLVPKGGVGIELGIAEGEFASRVCAKKHMSEWFGVDIYRDHHNDAEMDKMLERMSVHPEFQFIRSLFSDAVGKFEDEFFDIVYVDGYAHTGQEGGQTLDDWYPKVKSGGIFAGDDYDPRWGRTIAAVDEFVNKHNLQLNIIESREPNSKWSKFPSWWVRKP